MYCPVFALTHLPKAWDKLNWIRTSGNYEKICLNKWNICLNLAFSEKNQGKDWLSRIHVSHLIDIHVF